MTTTKKTNAENLMIQTSEQITKITHLVIDGFNPDALDHPDNAINDASGEENPRYNLGLFYQLGSMVDQAAYNCETAKQYADSASAKAADEQERNGNESATFMRLSGYAVKAEAHFENALMFFHMAANQYAVLMGAPWAGGKLTASDPYGRSWYQKERARRTERKVLTPNQPSAEDQRAAMRARLAS